MAKLTINENKKCGTIAPEIYGHFSEHLGRCIYEGVYVGEKSDIPNVNGMRSDVVEALKEIRVPVLRWPGGCFADEYHWMDGIGEKQSRKKLVNTHWGGVTEDNSFGTHEYMELCRQIGCKTYVNGNLGSGTVREMSEWVEYMTFSGVSPMADLRKKNGHEEPWVVDYFGVGNENWGCGGNMTAEHYANEYRRYQTYVRQFNKEHPISKVACGPGTADPWWTRKLLEICYDHAPEDSHGFMDLMSMHYYVVPGTWEHKGAATEYTDEEWYRTLRKSLFMDRLIRGHEAVTDQFDPDKKIGFAVDEWGNWFDVEKGTNPGFLYQQSTVRDALVAGITLNIFNKHCDRVRMACLAQTINVLQSVILTEGDRMVKTPTWHVLHQFRHHQGGALLQSGLTGVEEIGMGEEKVPAVTESVSEKDGVVTLTLNHLSLTDSADLSVQFADDRKREIVEASVVKSDDVHDCNTFDEPGVVEEKAFTDYRMEGRQIDVRLPAASVVLLRIK
ncbi:MAG: alpha-N-arabinofuranosidase [Lachnospiraceae bacterium]|nr:alpha-N-arabinofuranosidase [Lachnospiraceae bacterium]